MARLKNQTDRPRIYGFRLPPAYNIAQVCQQELSEI